MEMASALFNQIYIKTEKKCFGILTKVTYTPTNSPVVGVCLDYSPSEGQKVAERIRQIGNNADITGHKKRPKKPEKSNFPGIFFEIPGTVCTWFLW